MNTKPSPISSRQNSPYFQNPTFNPPQEQSSEILQRLNDLETASSYNQEQTDNLTTLVSRFLSSSESTLPPPSSSTIIIEDLLKKTSNLSAENDSLKQELIELKIRVGAQDNQIAAQDQKIKKINKTINAVLDSYR